MTAEVKGKNSPLASQRDSLHWQGKHVSRVLQMDEKWRTNTNMGKKAPLDTSLGPFQTFYCHIWDSIGIQKWDRKMQICEDIFISHVEQGQMDVKNVSWLIWKEHATLWENIWAVTLFWRIEGKNSKLSHPA